MKSLNVDQDKLAELVDEDGGEPAIAYDEKNYYDDILWIVHKIASKAASKTGVALEYLGDGIWAFTGLRIKTKKAGRVFEELCNKFFRSREWRRARASYEKAATRLLNALI
jgi:hypothetical protein